MFKFISQVIKKAIQTEPSTGFESIKKEAESPKEQYRKDADITLLLNSCHRTIADVVKKAKSDAEAKLQFEKSLDEIVMHVLSRIDSIEIAYQFVLEELDAASQGNDFSITFAEKSGISSNEYSGSLHNSWIEVDGPDGPQQTLHQISSLYPDHTAMIRVAVVDRIMRHYSFGKYSNLPLSIDINFTIPDQDITILALAKNSNIIYLNQDTDDIFDNQEDHHELNGRVVNFVYSGSDSNRVIEIFIAFHSLEYFNGLSDPSIRDNKFASITNHLFPQLRDNYDQLIISPFEDYASQYIYTFHTYKRNNQLFMINNAQSIAYLIKDNELIQNDVNHMKSQFWD